MHRFTPRVRIYSSLSLCALRAGSGLFGLLCLFFVLSGCTENKTDQASAKGKGGSPPLPVKVATVVRKDVPVELRAVGLAEPFASVEVKSQISGLLEKVGFLEGDQVKAGDILFRIDSRPYVSLLLQAEATRDKDLAALENARKQAERYLPAAENGYVSIEQSDAAQTSVATLQAQVKADEAQVVRARIDLDNCTIRSPISGHTGVLSEEFGNLVKAAADLPLVTINQISPIKVSFTLPEQMLSEVKKHLAAGDMEVVATSAEGALTGKLSFFDNKVNQENGTIRLKAIFANEAQQLWPGQFVNIGLRLTVRKDATVAPTRAIQSSQNGDFVYVVAQDQIVAVRPVVVAFSDEGQSVIESGLDVGEIVVTDGQLRLRAGAVVKTVSEPTTSSEPKAAQ